MWSFSRLLSRFNKNRKEAEEASSGDPSGTSTYDYWAALAASRGLWDTGQNPPLRLEEELTIQAMYKSWVELESSVSRAHDDLQTILAHRERAATLRREAEQVLLEGEAIRVEARRIGEFAWQAFGRGFAINPRGLASQTARLREVEEAIKTQAALQRASHRETWDEADKTRQKATADLLKVIMALRTAVVQVERELHESANLPAVAEALKESAQEELRGAAAIRNELAFLGQEALNVLGGDLSEGERPQEGLPLAEPRVTSLAPEETLVAFAPGPAQTNKLERSTPVYPDQEPQELLPVAEGAVEESTSVAWESAEAQPDQAGEVDKDAASQPEPVIDKEGARGEYNSRDPATAGTATRSPTGRRPTDNRDAFGESRRLCGRRLRREMEAISLSGPVAQDVPPSASDAPGGDPDVSKAAREPAESLPGGAAQELIRELEALSHPAESPESRTSSAAEELTNELYALTRLDPGAAPASEEVPPTIGFEPLSPGLDQGGATPRSADLPTQGPAVAGDQPGPAGLGATPTVDPPGPPPQSYRGRFFPMFPASLSQDSLESVWETLEEVAGPGPIVEMRLVSQDAGIQFTMDLGARELELDELRRRIRTAELVPLGTDRLRVNWSG